MLVSPNTLKIVKVERSQDSLGSSAQPSALAADASEVKYGVCLPSALVAKASELRMC